MHERLIDVMRLRDAGGSSLDHICVDGAESLRRKRLG
jgi:predicted butyrate kinase (DUF1464 family)